MLPRSKNYTYPMIRVHMQDVYTLTMKVPSTLKKPVQYTPVTSHYWSAVAVLYPTYLRLVLIKREAGVTGCIIEISTTVIIVPPVVRIRVSYSRAVDADPSSTGLPQWNIAYQRKEIKIGGTTIFFCPYQEGGRHWG